MKRKRIRDFGGFLLESQEVINADMRPINALERDTLKKFQEIVSIVWEFGGEGEFDEFKEKVVPYLKYPFAEHMKKYIDDVSAFQKAKGKVKDGPDLLRQHGETYEKVLAEFKRGKISHDIKKLQKLNSDIVKVVRTVSSVAKEKFYNPYKLSGARAFFGGRDVLIDDFGKDELEAFKNTDLDKPLYTYLNFPKKKLRSFEDLLYFMRELSESPKPKRIGKGMIKTYSAFLNDDNVKTDYVEFIAKVDSYLYSNDNKLIDEIMTGIKKYPELVKANEKSKRRIKTVYRGLGFYYENIPKGKDAVLKMEKKNKYVATSESRHVAERFAEMRGHLESRRRSEMGYVIEYVVDRDSIILDATIFGSPYGEGEILIDATKAKVKNIRTH